MKLRVIRKKKQRKHIACLKSVSFIKYDDFLGKVLSYWPKHVSKKNKRFWWDLEGVFLKRKEELERVLSYAILCAHEDFIDVEKLDLFQIKMLFQQNLQEREWKKYLMQHKIVILFDE